MSCPQSHEKHVAHDVPAPLVWRLESDYDDTLLPVDWGRLAVVSGLLPLSVPWRGCSLTCGSFQSGGNYFSAL